jgi:pyruvate dehydrogenase complex dehydrogenase (E1) component
LSAYNHALKSKKSSIIIANTIKGKGFGVAENNIEFSHQKPSEFLIKELKKKYE